MAGMKFHLKMTGLLLAMALCSCHSSSAPSAAASPQPAAVVDEAQAELQRVQQLEQGCCNSTQ